jgi:hypothetical protein
MSNAAKPIIRGEYDEHLGYDCMTGGVKDGSEWTVRHVKEMEACCTDGQFTIRVNMRNIHTDGKPRKSGFSLIKGETK